MTSEIHLDGSPPPAESAWRVTIAGRELGWRQVGSAVLLALGGIAVLVGWVGVGQKTEVYEQLPFLLSGGVGGLALILTGLGLYNAHQHAMDRAGIAELNRHLSALELGLGGEFDQVLGRLDELAGSRRSTAPVRG